MTPSTLNLQHIDRQIAQEMGVTVSDLIPAYTTDLNVAIELMEYWWVLCRYEYNDITVYDVSNTENGYHESLCTDKPSPALSICKARFPHLFESEETS